MYPTYYYLCSTQKCLNRNVFCKPQDPLLVIPLHIYLFASETLKYNMILICQGFWWCLMKSITWFLVFWACFAFFVFWKNIRYGYLHYIQKIKNIFMYAQVPPYFVIYIGGNSGNWVKVNFGSELLVILGKTSKYMRATFNLCQSSF